MCDRCLKMSRENKKLRQQLIYMVTACNNGNREIQRLRMKLKLEPVQHRERVIDETPNGPRITTLLR